MDVTVQRESSDIQKLVDSIVIQPREIIEARRHWGIFETRLFAFAISNNHPHIPNAEYVDIEFRKAHLSFDETMEVFSRSDVGHKGTRKDVDREIAKAVHSLAETTIDIGTPKNPASFPVFAMVTFNQQEGLTMLFSPLLTKILLELKGRPYTITQFVDSLALSTSKSVFFLQWLQEYNYMGESDGKNGRIWDRQGTLEELKFILGLDVHSYPNRVDAFRRKAIVPAIKEICARLPYEITVTPWKKGRGGKIVGFVFHVHELEPWSGKPLLEKKKALEAATTIDAEVEISESSQKQEVGATVANTMETAQNATARDRGNTDIDEDIYLRHVMGDCGVVGNVARKFIKELGWQRCKVISDSVEAAGGGAGGIVAAWKNNEPWHAKTKKMATKEPPQKMPIALRNDEMNFA